MYFERLHQLMGTLKFLEYIVDGKWMELNKLISVLDFTEPLTYKMVENNIIELTENNLQQLFKKMNISCFQEIIY